VRSRGSLPRQKPLTGDDAVGSRSRSADSMTPPVGFEPAALLLYFHNDSSKRPQVGAKSRSRLYDRGVTQVSVSILRACCASCPGAQSQYTDLSSSLGGKIGPFGRSLPLGRGGAGLPRSGISVGRRWATLARYCAQYRRTCVVTWAFRVAGLPRRRPRFRPAGRVRRPPGRTRSKRRGRKLGLCRPRAALPGHRGRRAAMPAVR
jgi:hypothetical protein